MTRYEQIKSWDVDNLATFIYDIIAETEEHMLGVISALGIEASLCSLSEDVRIANIKHDLLQEVDDEHT